MSSLIDSPFWQKSLAVERYGNQVLDAIYGQSYIIVHATKDHQTKGKIDRFHIHKQDGRVIFRVDYKTDERAGETNRLAFEHISVDRKGKPPVMGWVHTSHADLLISYVPAHDRAYVIELSMVRARWAEIQNSDRCIYRSTPGGPDYLTWCYCAKIPWLREKGFFKHEKQAVGAQMRLPLKK